MCSEILKIKILLLFLLFISCGVDTTVSEPSSSGSSDENPITVTKPSQPKVTTKITQPKKTVSSNNSATSKTKVVTSSFKPKVSNPDNLINNLFYRLQDEIDVEVEKWEEVNNPDCENSSLQSCGVTDIFAETALKNVKRNSLLNTLLKVNMNFIEFYYYYLEEVENCDEVLDWYISNGGKAYYMGNLNLAEACNNTQNGANILYEYLEEIEKMDKTNSLYIQEMYCNATSQTMKNLIHRVIISGDINSLFYAGITPGASWSYCPTDSEYPPQDNG